MLTQMIELEEVQIVEFSDETLEQSLVAKAAAFTGTAPCYGMGGGC